MRPAAVVVGGSLAGVHAARALREGGFDGPVTVLSAEPHAPYDRPPLSKQLLSGEQGPAGVALAPLDGLGIEWRGSCRAVGLDPAARTVELAGGGRLRWDGLVVATGAEPRRLAGPDLPGSHVLRTLDDALALRADLDAGPGRVVVVGGGFLGAEVAATCRGRGLPVTLVEPALSLLARALAPAEGAVCAALHRDHGVDLRLGVGVAAVRGTRRVEEVQLADGTVVAADVVVTAIGVRPAVGWLAGSGLPTGDGVECDATCLVAPGVVAAGDAARWWSGRHGGPLRVEHWDNAVQQGVAAGRRLLAELAPGSVPVVPYDPVPWVWSDQYDRKLQVFGVPGPADEVRVVAGSYADRRFVTVHGRGGRLVAVVGMNMPGRLARLGARLAAGAGLAEVA